MSPRIRDFHLICSIVFSWGTFPSVGTRLFHRFGWILLNCELVSLVLSYHILSRRNRLCMLPRNIGSFCWAILCRCPRLVSSNPNDRLANCEPAIWAFPLILSGSIFVKVDLLSRRQRHICYLDFWLRSVHFLLEYWKAPLIFHQKVAIKLLFRSDLQPYVILLRLFRR